MALLRALVMTKDWNGKKKTLPYKRNRQIAYYKGKIIYNIH